MGVVADYTCTNALSLLKRDNNGIEWHIQGGSGACSLGKILKYAASETSFSCIFDTIFHFVVMLLAGLISVLYWLD
jgi:hypothetical protein